MSAAAVLDRSWQSMFAVLLIGNCSSQMCCFKLLGFNPADKVKENSKVMLMYSTKGSD